MWICKVIEHIIYQQVMNHLNQNNILVNYQHGFRKGHSCERQLLQTVDEISRAMDNRKQVNVMILDFSKAFDTVPHRRLLEKLSHYGIQQETHGWIQHWLIPRDRREVYLMENRQLKSQ
ncbi:uncharacterized protein LOC110440250 [Mizuhopecten yessoensis]|uniref:uncharacterized protein LOC110440250 n=1 Tax=Mizuhopecten yessoensis TaxID=6573 RepID=UPI000B4572F9|nr:uncharacterized protein LOC110440250 [Mizuhopecten yessoensis]